MSWGRWSGVGRVGVVTLVARVFSVGAGVLVLVGFPAAVYGSAWAVWQGRGDWRAALLFIGTVLFMWVGIVWLVKQDAPVLATAMLVVHLAWLVFVYVRIDMRDDQMMHDRGVTAQATVVQWVRTSDPWAGVQNEVTAIDVSLPGGAGNPGGPDSTGGPDSAGGTGGSGAVERLQLKGARAPQVGAYVQVTRDPGGQVPIRLGPRPDAPGGVVAWIFLAVMTAGSLICSTGAAVAVAEALAER
ncbi:hypothetical protein [Streptomyces sp. NPDC051567]|uniref:hypothetical protein n=1 Tax=Streptomyces sp. NPDC051567 TaxID=3365660 RepID=UPI003789B274